MSLCSHKKNKKSLLSHSLTHLLSFLFFFYPSSPSTHVCDFIFYISFSLHCSLPHTDPQQWTKEQVQCWADWCSKELGLNSIHLQLLRDVSGQQLCRFTSQQFQSVCFIKEHAVSLQNFLERIKAYSPGRCCSVRVKQLPTGRVHSLLQSGKTITCVSTIPLASFQGSFAHRDSQETRLVHTCTLAY